MDTAFKSLQPQLLIKDHTIALTITLTLNTICEGTTEGEYRQYMDAARSLLVNQQPRNKEFRRFAFEFLQYHDILNSLTSLDRRTAGLQGHLCPPDFMPDSQTGAFLGVFDGLFHYLSEVTKIRDQIRYRLNKGYELVVDCETLKEALSIDSAIRSWKNPHEPKTPNWFLAQLYSLMAWIYLHRTIWLLKPSENTSRAVDDGLLYLDQLPQDSGANSIVLMPLFILGISASVPRQRDRIERGFEYIQSYSNLRNIQPAFKIAKRVWEAMDSNIPNIQESWDWEKRIKEMNMDLLIT